MGIDGPATPQGLNGPTAPQGHRQPPWIVATPSRVSEFTKCRRAYFNSSILSLGGEHTESPAIEVGLLVHSLLADSHAAGGCISREAIGNAADLHGEEIASMLEAHYDLCPAQSGATAHLLGAEMDLAWWDSSTRTHFRGRLDAVWDVDGTLTVRDYKTGRHPEEDHRSRFDVSAYAALAAVNFTGIRPIAVEFEYLASGALERVAFDEFSFQDALARIRGMAKEIAGTREFPGNPGIICESCDFRSVCPESAA